jgi:hypothetical protein
VTFAIRITVEPRRAVEEILPHSRVHACLRRDTGDGSEGGLRGAYCETVVTVPCCVSVVADATRGTNERRRQAAYGVKNGSLTPALTSRARHSSAFATDIETDRCLMMHMSIRLCELLWPVSSCSCFDAEPPVLFPILF